MITTHFNMLVFCCCRNGLPLVLRLKTMQAYYFIIMVIKRLSVTVLNQGFWHNNPSEDPRIYYYYFPASIGCPHFLALRPGQVSLLLPLVCLLRLFFFTPYKHLWLLWVHWNNLRQPIIIIWIWDNSPKLMCSRRGSQLVVELGSGRNKRTWDLMEVGHGECFTALLFVQHLYALFFYFLFIMRWVTLLCCTLPDMMLHLTTGWEATKPTDCGLNLWKREAN